MLHITHIFFNSVSKSSGNACLYLFDIYIYIHLYVEYVLSIYTYIYLFELYICTKVSMYNM